MLPFTIGIGEELNRSRKPVFQFRARCENLFLVLMIWEFSKARMGVAPNFKSLVV
jgi:hypothetical protein